MAGKSSIEWTESTWNPVTGCDKVSLGCKFCYAERMALRLKAMRHPNYLKGFKLTLHHHVLDYPFQWKNPRVIFVNSMSDLFHQDVPYGFVEKVFHVMRQADWHIYQILTKRADRLVQLNRNINWPTNVWMGVSVETEGQLGRVQCLQMTKAKVKFLSLEPLLGALPELDLDGIDWVIVGGESGPGARPMKKKWVVDIRDQCIQAGIPFFFKQWGGVNKKRNGRLLNGESWDEMPKKNTTGKQVALSLF